MNKPDCLGRADLSIKHLQTIGANMAVYLDQSHAPVTISFARPRRLDYVYPSLRL
jgi:hypothetical protein